MDVLRVSDVRAVIALIDGHVYPRSFGVRHIVEDEAGMGEFEVFEQAVEFAAVQRTPGTVKIISRLGLLPCVIVVQELIKYTELLPRLTRDLLFPRLNVCAH